MLFSQPTVSEWVSGKKVPSTDNLAKFSKGLNVTMNYIKGIDNPEDKINDNLTISYDDIKVALFGGSGEVTPEMWEEVKRFAEFVKQQEKEKKESGEK
ncbi:MAG: helix-turn-helix domain-containing protein [Clostridia bacterium]